MEFQRDESREDFFINDMAVKMHDPTRHQPSVSGMIKCITRTYYENEIKLDNKPSLSRREIQLFSVGLYLEQLMFLGYQNAVGDEYDGISFHVDHFDADNSILYEMKSTRIKAVHDNDPKITLSWQKQWLAYAKALGITEGYFVLLHINGDYAPNFPDLRVYKVIASQEEIDNNWTWIKQRAITYLKFVKDNEIPTPFEYNESWECKECPWIGICKVKALVNAG